ncbi:MAG: hypothetical protein ABI165_20815 [Bryobacteraceae bacterium]
MKNVEKFNVFHSRSVADTRIAKAGADGDTRLLFPIRRLVFSGFLPAFAGLARHTMELFAGFLCRFRGFPAQFVRGLAGFARRLIGFGLSLIGGLMGIAAGVARI